VGRKEIENIIISQLLEFQPLKVGLFVSFARYEEREDSDIDILVSFKHPLSLIELIRIENKLSESIGVKVDLITENSIRNNKLREHIIKDLHLIYNA